MTKKVLVTGATGQQGGAVARELLKLGHEVRAFVRDVDSAKSKELVELGASLAEGSFNDADSIKAAAEGVDSIFIVSNMYEGIDQESIQGIRVVDAAVAAGVEHIVFSSVAGANANSGVPHFDSKFKIEERIQEVAPNWTIVAPVFFMENWTFEWNLPPLLTGKVRQAFSPSTSLQMISYVDIGRFTAFIIDQGSLHYGQRIEIAGDSLTGTEIAEALATATGKPMEFEVQPREEVAAMMEDVALMYDWFESTGFSADIKNLQSEYRHIGWTSFDQWAAKQNWAALLTPSPATV
ncbi:MAG: NmrA/HSCARG family protein [Dehalococcoidia bacterium]